jgi:hypothetical protein
VYDLVVTVVDFGGGGDASCRSAYRTKCSPASDVFACVWDAVDCSVRVVGIDFVSSVEHRPDGAILIGVTPLLPGEFTSDPLLHHNAKIVVPKAATAASTAPIEMNQARRERPPHSSSAGSSSCHAKARSVPVEGRSEATVSSKVSDCFVSPVSSDSMSFNSGCYDAIRDNGDPVNNQAG